MPIAMTVGVKYKMSGYNVICVGFTKKGKAKMQTCGMTVGKWPGEGDISDYDEKIRAFTTDWNGVISKFQLPSKKKAKNNRLILTALNEAARNYSSFGASYSGAWIGTVSGSTCAWYVYSNGYVGSGSNQSNSNVVAPSFNLDMDNITINEDGEVLRCSK